MVLFSCYIISVGNWSGVILMLHYYFRPLAWCHSDVTLLVSATGMVSFSCYIISVGKDSGVILVLYY
jgi:hypothetical protein